MYGEEEVLIGSCTRDVGGEKKGHRKDGLMSKSSSTTKLKRNDSENNILGQWLGPTEFGYLIPSNVSKGSSFVTIKGSTSGCALIMACRLDRWGSSV